MGDLRLPQQNIVIVTGRLTKDPDIFTTEGGVIIASMYIAIDNGYYDKNKQEWIKRTVFTDVKCFGKAAERVQERLKKGYAVSIVGKLQFDQWEKDGEKRSKLYIIANSTQLLTKVEKLTNVNQKEQVNTEEVPF